MVVHFNSLFFISDNEFTLEIFVLLTLIRQTLNVSSKSGLVLCVQSSRGQVRSLLSQYPDNIACRGAQNKHLPRTEKEKMKPIKAVCQRWRGLIACHPLILVSYGRELKIACMFICLYIIYYSNLSVFANGTDENAEEGRTLA